MVERFLQRENHATLPVSPARPLSSRVEVIDLTKDLMENPKPTLEVEEGSFAVATYTPEYPYLTTHCIDSCKGIVFHDPIERRGLMCHLSTTNNTRRLVQALIRELCGNFSRVSAYVVTGDWQCPLPGYPNVRQLTDQISKFRPARLFVDRGFRKGERAITLNLGSGEVRELYCHDRTYFTGETDGYKMVGHRLEDLGLSD